MMKSHGGKSGNQALSGLFGVAFASFVAWKTGSAKDCSLLGMHAGRS
ncbi:hypothetical protein NKH18_46950 [Streptomyces sp. M10(2022)]